MLTAINENHSQFANAIRFLSIDAVEKAKSGHPGMPMGMADVATVLWRYFLRFDPCTPDWPNRDRFVLSAGHGSMLLYSLLYLTGYKDMTLEQLQNFRQLDSITAGHPEYGHATGIETTTGPLGQGIATAVGMALAGKILQAQFGSTHYDYKTYVIASDGDLMEGISQEAISLAGHLKLNNLVVLYDDNEISIDGSTTLAFSDDTAKRFAASHWDTISVDGHNPDEIYGALSKAQCATRPVLIICKTTIAYGSPNKAGTSASHGSPLGMTEIEETRTSLNWPHAAFEIPEAILKAWRDIGQLHQASAAPGYKDQDITAILAPVIDKLKQQFVANPQTFATRQLSQLVLEEVAALIPNLIGGSADLTGSNNTKAKSQGSISANDFNGHYIHYGVREHAMAAIMNGMCLSGLRPYGGTFLIFCDYLRPSLRLAALMELPVIYVLTHDSIGLGEDGPTHQPIEHLASLRAIPNLNVFRPADAIEVAECWQLALDTEKTPSVLTLTRQNVATVRSTHETENLCAKGGYVVYGSTTNPTVTVIATGSEVGLAVEVAKRLQQHHIDTRVVSMPCTRLFDQQTLEYRQSVLPDATLKVAIEAASPYGWERYVGLQGLIFGIDRFGASAPAPQLFEKFGLTVKHITKSVLQRLSKS